MMVEFKKHLAGYYGEVSPKDRKDIRKDVAHDLIARGFAVEIGEDEPKKVINPADVPNAKRENATLTPPLESVAADETGTTGQKPRHRATKAE